MDGKYLFCWLDAKEGQKTQKFITKDQLLDFIETQIAINLDFVGGNSYERTGSRWYYLNHHGEPI